MMVEPPGDTRRGGVLEIDDGVFVTDELAFVKKRTGAVHESVILVGSFRVHTLAMEPCKERCGASSVEAFVVVEDANPQRETT